MGDQPTAAELARRVADALETDGLPYAIGGAIALGFYAVPRATVDVDVNVFVPPNERLPEVLAALGKIGFDGEDPPDILQERASSEGQCRGRITGLRVDVFVPVIPYYQKLESRRRQVNLLGRPIWILDAADLVVLKMMFFRRKDLADVEAVLRTQGRAIDLQFVRAKRVELAGERDERVEALSQIERDVQLPVV